MDGIVVRMSRRGKRELEHRHRHCQDGKLKLRYLMLINLLKGRSVVDTANALQVSRSTVYRVAKRFEREGVEGLIDRRENNGPDKLDDRFLAVLWDLVAASPRDHGWPRPTWTREMLVQSCYRKAGVRIHVSTMSVALRKIGARRGRPKPVVQCPWSKRAKNRRLRELEQLIQDLPANEVLVYEDEVDIHLNPKIGCDWMVPGQQKSVVTPGKNQKCYLAGALDARTGELTWVEGDQKKTSLFIALLWRLHQRYRQARRIHVILDNYAIHSTEVVKQSLATEVGSHIQLHFLPPYCPDHNKIERIWQDLHANVTRNHQCPSMVELRRHVRTYLKQRSRAKDRDAAMAA